MVTPIQIFKFAIPVLIVGFISNGIVQAQNPSDEVPALCKQVGQLEIPKTDQTPKDKELSIEACKSDDADFDQAKDKGSTLVRYCAMKQKKSDDSAVFGGSSTLMMLYANGFGVQKNIPLAEKFACGLQTAPTEMESRLQHLENLKIKVGSVPFDICDDITSGLMMGHCEARREALKKKTRDAKFMAIVARWPQPHRNAFAKLQAASKAFIQARANDEVDLSGTARSMLIIQEESIQERDFIQSVEAFEQKKDNRYASQVLFQENKKMSQLLKRIRETKDETIRGTVTNAQIVTTQEKWTKYLDAWIEFAKLRYPSVASDSVAAWFTKKRNHMLSSFSN